VLGAAVEADAALHTAIDMTQLRRLFDAVAATAPAQALAHTQLQQLQQQIAALDAASAP